ncbi:hypothetical protein DVH05_008651 [Phytophthora capsici]|nr:hypothetical protein DVH05_008651 [Phytophthora capsici]
MQSMDVDSNQHDIRDSTGAGGREITVEVLLHATKLSVGKKEQLSHYLKRITHLALNGDASKALEKGGSDSGAIHKIQNLHHCPNLKVLYLYDNEVERIENLDAVPQLTHLHLQGNHLRKIENLETLKLLEKLYLEKNCIVRLEGLAGCPRLKELYLANQHVPIDTQFAFEEDSMRALASSLRVLDLSNCRVASTKALLLLRCLEQLDLSKNLISDLEEVFALVGGVTSLVELDLRGNEVTATAKYREKTITFSSARLGRLLLLKIPLDVVLIFFFLAALLDKKNVDPNQRRMMQSHLAHKYRYKQHNSESNM